MSEHYDFHYQPTGSGAISGQQVLQQTEDAINELGDYVNDNVGGAMDVAQQALETAQNAETNAQTALDTANSFSSAIQSAQQDASTALSTAQTAQTTASNANNTAIQAQQDASSAVTTANNASGQVSTLSGTVTALGQRVTTAEGNIGQNTSDITALTTRVGTTEGNITTLQNDVSVAMGNASSAMATAGQVKQQAFVFRYSSTALVASSTNSNSLLDNTDNLKVGDKVIDSSGVLFSITAIDTANSTFTIGSALIDLALDANVVHTSGNETIGGNKTFTNDILLRSLSAEYGVTSGNVQISFYDKNNVKLSKIMQGCYLSGLSFIRFHIYGKDSNNQNVENSIDYAFWSNTSKTYFRSSIDNFSYLGSENNRWAGVYAVKYYYGSDNTEFSTKFVTTDTAQTIAYSKTFTTTQSFTGYTTIRMYSPSDEVGVLPSASQVREVRFTDKNNVPISYFAFQHRADANEPFRTCWRQMRLDGTENYYSVNFNNLGEFYPESNNGIKLGTSTKRWKDVQTYQINGITPSSLSLPATGTVDISGYVTDLTGNTVNTYSPVANGYIVINCNANNVDYIKMSNNLNFVSVVDNTNNQFTSGLLGVWQPCVAGISVQIRIKASALNSAKFIPCQGNV